MAWCNKRADDPTGGRGSKRRATANAERGRVEELQTYRVAAVGAETSRSLVPMIPQRPADLSRLMAKSNLGWIRTSERERTVRQCKRSRSPQRLLRLERVSESSKHDQFLLLCASCFWRRPPVGRGHPGATLGDPRLEHGLLSGRGRNMSIGNWTPLLSPPVKVVAATEVWKWGFSHVVDEGLPVILD